MKLSSATGLRLGIVVAASLLWLRFSEQAAAMSFVNSVLKRDSPLGENLSDLPWLSVGVYLWAIAVALTLYRPVFGAFCFLLTSMPLFYMWFDGYADAFLWASAALIFAPLCIWADILASAE
jgi:hypothetical protein